MLAQETDLLLEVEKASYRVTLNNSVRLALSKKRHPQYIHTWGKRSQSQDKSRNADLVDLPHVDKALGQNRKVFVAPSAVDVNSL